MTAPIPFERINQAALACLESLLTERFPAGKRQGREYKVGDIHGTAGESLSVNLDSGVWSDFAGQIGGSDPISIFAAADHAGRQADAARALGKKLGVYTNGGSSPQAKPDGWTPLIPPPPDAPPPAFGRHDMLHTYRDAAGTPTHYVRRIEARNGERKQFWPLTYGVLDGRRGWHSRHAGSPKPLYNLHLLAAYPTAPVVVHEGEKKADAAAFAFPDYVHVAWPGGSKAVGQADWTPLLNRRVIIWPDNDETGHKAAAEIAARLSQARVLQVRDLPEGHDAADIQPDDPEAWLRERLPPELPVETPLPLLWFDDIMPVLEARDFVQGVLVEGGAAVVYGDSNAGKTFWVTDLALHVATGRVWNGRRVDQGGVVYCAMEGGNGFRNRVSAWRQGHVTPRVTCDAVTPFAAIPASLNLLDPEADTPRLIETIQAAAKRMGRPVKLLVVDTLSRAMAGGNENASDDMGALVRSMDAIRAATGACVLFVHHSGKDAAKGARGHSLLRAAVDTEIEVRTDEASGSRTASVVKQRELTKGAAFGFRLDVHVLGQNQHGEDVTTCTVAPEAADLRPLRPGTKLSTEDQGWLNDIQDLFADSREDHQEVQPDPDMTPVTCVTRERLRTWLQHRGRVGVTPCVTPSVTGVTPLTSTERMRLMRHLNRLKDKGKIGLLGDWVWLT